ncbi:hypothetical protein P9250_05085 [Caballeronia sp. LP006]|jgi:hypothetical protein|uniref:hypothetical protein n=1 Tax=unclassified Caballeronia TaxID=2646786 RepID=UPI001FD445B3|nr:MULTISPECIES: hypothetical protein [unclassified Caballeronia]MDR5774852.1 hypothetical protein [Caballeronia sp. LZ002]MDR5799545.1 hypothetical protein [Caballeronia sp. LZ001]MDR5827237.1 hypothetical protein [Caballeronia sp. LP006]MDR5850288.1 hypothetical protein [Caballeronia sp. LZ003]
MEVTINELAGLLEELEQEDPVDYGDLPFGEPELRRLVLTSLLERHRGLQDSGLNPGDVSLTYMLTTALLVLENLVLHARIMLLQGQRIDVNALLRKYSGS